ncbi:MAG: matrixin family metalloprotease, partial [Deltaproteobacteria bacterium]|nr:matrixin family metalloprotease [Deltaproteobacteria bacterium]
MRTERRLGLGLGLALAVGAADAAAFCRTMTCDPRTERCEAERGCITSGVPVAWADECVSFGTQAAGSKRRKISFAQADSVFRRAFQAWATADCGGGRRPSFRVYDLVDAYGPIQCDEPEYNRVEPNANVWMFRDDKWSHAEDEGTLAVTMVEFDRRTGALLDADVEFNSLANEFTLGDTNVKVDLLSVATHEAGHFLGLDHSNDDDATMYATYPPGNLDIRTLHRDDIAGICAAYPPERKTPPCDGPHPPHGFSTYCGSGDDDGPPGVRACTLAAQG